MFSRILIANRGEIARRIIRTCTRLGIETVAIYSDADADAPHVREATTACHVGGEAASQSYLNQAAIIEAALRTSAEAIHPGYGFLSEKAAFASAVGEAGLTFIGPAPNVIELMGDKARAKSLMQRAGVPTVPGSPEATGDLDEIVRLVGQIGLPALLKPTAGGGGKGMRVLRDGDDVNEAAAAAYRIAASSFGDGRMLVERFVERPRHIEVQIFGDGFGNVVHLFERECSLQRRHQKVIEEAPALHLDPVVRDRLLAAAVDGARAIGYTNAGTFEFILSGDGQFYFLEVNTRLQVEHPVTEATIGLDLVEWQLRVASGEALPLAQHEIELHGHAIEARVYAEDPEAGFQPSPGRVESVHWPDGVRVDAAIVGGSWIGTAYDPMIAKVIAYGSDRQEALTTLRKSLENSLILGTASNLGYLQALLAHPDVVAGNLDTGLVDKLTGLLSPAETDRMALAAYAAAMLERAPPSPWRVRSTGAGMHRSALVEDAPLGVISADIAGRAGEAKVLAGDSGEWQLTIDGRSYRASAFREGALWCGTVDGTRWWASVLPDGSMVAQVAGLGRRLSPRSFQVSGDARGHTAVVPLPGVLTRIDVQLGDEVRGHDRLAVVEAMKMEIPILAPVDGVVEEIACAEGDNVVGDQVLFRLRLKCPEDGDK